MKYDNKVLFISFYFHTIKPLLLGVTFYFRFIFAMSISRSIAHGRNVCIMARANILKYITVGLVQVHILYVTVCSNVIILIVCIHNQWNLKGPNGQIFEFTPSKAIDIMN